MINKKVDMNKTPESRTRRTRICETVRTQIENDILIGVLYPNQRIIEQDIATKIGCSRAPVREALNQLEMRNLINRLPSGGYIVAVLSEEDIRQTFEVQEALEAVALKLACKKITEKSIRKLTTYLNNYQKEINKKIHIGASNIDHHWSILFHDELLAVCGNSKLISYIKGIVDVEQLTYVTRFFNLLEYGLFYEEHSRIVRAISERNYKETIKANKAHLDTKCKLYLKYLSHY